MADRVNLTLGPLVMADEQGNEMFTSGAGPMKWTNLPYPEAVEIQARVLQMLQGLVNDMGRAKAKGK